METNKLELELELELEQMQDFSAWNIWPPPTL